MKCWGEPSCDPLYAGDLSPKAASPPSGAVPDVGQGACEAEEYMDLTGLCFSLPALLGENGRTAQHLVPACAMFLKLSQSYDQNVTAL